MADGVFRSLGDWVIRCLSLSKAPDDPITQDALHKSDHEGKENTMNATIQQALDQDETIDITTIGRKSGRPKRMEIWFRQVAGRTYITGTPGARDWYANLLAEPRFTFHLKESVQADLPARAQPITDLAERRRILGDPVMRWYHQQVASLDELVAGSPLVEVLFAEEEE